MKSEAGGGHFETIDDQADVIKLAGRGGTIDLAAEFGFPEERLDSLDRASELAIGAGLDALRDAGIPLVMQYKETTTGTRLPDRWMLPESYQPTTGVIFASAFPGNNAWMEEAERYYGVQALEQRLEDLRSLQSRIAAVGSVPQLTEDLGRKIQDMEAMALRGVDEKQIDDIIMEFEDHVQKYMDVVTAGEAGFEGSTSITEREDRELARLEKEIVGEKAPSTEAETESPAAEEPAPEPEEEPEEEEEEGGVMLEG